MGAHAPLFDRYEIIPLIFENLNITEATFGTPNMIVAHTW